MQIIFYGIIFTSAYNYLLQLCSLGNSIVPLIFLIVSAIVNIILDIVFIVPFKYGVGGAAYATVVAQIVSAIGLAVYALERFQYYV